MTNSPNTTNLSSENGVSRRSVVTTGVATAAALAAGTGVALASAPEDAELKRLWARWLEQFKQVCAAITAQGRAEEAYFPERPPHPNTEFHVCGGEYGWFLRERRSRVPMPFPDPDESVFRCPSATSWDEANEIATKRAAAERAAFDKTDEAARKRHGVDEAEAASTAGWDKLSEIEQAITEAPAEGMFGVGVKLAIWRHYQFICLNVEPHEDEDTWPHEQPAIAAYYAAVALTGVDFEATIRAIEGY